MKNVWNKIVDQIPVQWRFPIVIELLTLVVLFYVSVQMYDLQYRAISSAVWTRTMDLTEYPDLSDDGEESVVGPQVLRDYMDKNWIQGVDHEAMVKNSALIVTLWNSEGSVEASTSRTNDLLFWQDKEGETPLQYLALEQYFSAEECRKIREFAQRSKPWASNGVNNLMLRYMDGYVNEDGNWIPLAIQFGVYKDDPVLTLTTDEQLPEGAFLVRYESPCSEGDWTAVGKGEEFIKEGLFGIPEQTIKANSWIYFWNTREDLYEKAMEVAGDPEVLERPTLRDNVPGSGVQGSDYCVYRWISPSCASVASGVLIWAVDRRGLVLSSNSFREIWFTTLLFMQVLVLLGIRNYRKYEKKNRELQENRNIFLNAAAHELKTPAAVIKNSAECIRAGICPEKQPHYLDVIDNASDQISDLVNHMLVYTRVSDSGYTICKETVEVRELVYEAIKPYEVMIRQRNMTWMIEIPKGTCISCDQDLMLLVVKNLLSNAVEYGTENGEIRVCWKENTLIVFNSGRGIRETDMEHLWEPLYRGDESRGSGSESSGMGLAICAAILKLHGCEYGVRNVDHGVEFWIRMKD